MRPCPQQVLVDIDRAGLSVAFGATDHRFRLMVPGTLGRATESYEMMLEPDPSAARNLVRANAGVGRLF
jgi:hypothetical protein